VIADIVVELQSKLAMKEQRINAGKQGGRGNKKSELDAPANPLSPKPGTRATVAKLSKLSELKQRRCLLPGHARYLTSLGSILHSQH
jgi:hypothetical protein